MGDFLVPLPEPVAEALVEEHPLLVVGLRGETADGATLTVDFNSILAADDRVRLYNVPPELWPRHRPSPSTSRAGGFTLLEVGLTDDAVRSLRDAATRAGARPATARRTQAVVLAVLLHAEATG